MRLAAGVILFSTILTFSGCGSKNAALRRAQIEPFLTREVRLIDESASGLVTKWRDEQGVEFTYSASPDASSADCDYAMRLFDGVKADADRAANEYRPIYDGFGFAYEDGSYHVSLRSWEQIGAIVEAARKVIESVGSLPIRRTAYPFEIPTVSIWYGNREESLLQIGFRCEGERFDANVIDFNVRRCFCDLIREGICPEKLPDSVLNSYPRGKIDDVRVHGDPLGHPLRFSYSSQLDDYVVLNPDAFGGTFAALLKALGVTFDTKEDDLLTWRIGGTRFGFSRKDGVLFLRMNDQMTPLNRGNETYYLSRGELEKLFGASIVIDKRLGAVFIEKSSALN